MLQSVKNAGAAPPALSDQQRQALASALARRLHQRLRVLSLSRGGLADAIAGLGAVPGAGETQTPAQAETVLELLFLSRHQLDQAIAVAASKAGVASEDIKPIALEILTEQLRGIAARANGELAELHMRMPQLLHFSRDSMHEEIADVIRRRCGAGPYGRVHLRRNARNILADACGYRGRGATSWYLGRLAAPIAAIARRIETSLWPRQA